MLSNTKQARGEGVSQFAQCARPLSEGGNFGCLSKRFNYSSSCGTRLPAEIGPFDHDRLSLTG